MPIPEDGRKLQNLYPEPQTRSGMDARQPTKFTIPVIRLSLVLFLPLYFLIAVASLYMYTDELTTTAVGVNSIALSAAIIIISAVSIILLGYARTLVIRNCARSWIIEVLYVFVVIPLGFVLLYKVETLFGGVSSLQILGIEAGILYAANLFLALIARLLSR